MNHNVQFFIGADFVVITFLDPLGDSLDARRFPRMGVFKNAIGAQIHIGLRTEIFVIHHPLSKEAAMCDESVTLTIFRFKLEIFPDDI